MKNTKRISMLFIILLASISTWAQALSNYEQKRYDLAYKTIQCISDTTSFYKDGRIMTLASILLDGANQMEKNGIRTGSREERELMDNMIAKFFCLDDIEKICLTDIEILYLEALQGNGCDVIVLPQYGDILLNYFQEREKINKEKP